MSLCQKGQFRQRWSIYELRVCHGSGQSCKETHTYQPVLTDSCLISGTGNCSRHCCETLLKVTSAKGQVSATKSCQLPGLLWEGSRLGPAGAQVQGAFATFRPISKSLTCSSSIWPPQDLLRKPFWFLKLQSAFNTKFNFWDTSVYVHAYVHVCVSQGGLKFGILLPLALKCWFCRYHHGDTGKPWLSGLEDMNIVDLPSPLSIFRTFLSFQAEPLHSGNVSASFPCL